MSKFMTPIKSIWFVDFEFIVVDGHMALVSPAAFKAFIEKNGRRSQGDTTAEIRAIQTDIKRLKLHKKNVDGGDIVKVHIDGLHKKTAINAFLFSLEHIKNLDHLADNPVMKLPKSIADRSD